ncbi:uncharacterized protein LOC124913060 [Impatiens glandulifera]|uniref:uncharacterized protein LOC124913060 n=1 Tax=Impatiens glandulifera TaxID=253017 RepID=UPI001FB15427|nr:uncharacterized protein LOC124913060 [Impatiens glandulifera]
MAKEEEVFDFSSEEFTNEDLVTALNDMIIEFKNIFSLIPIRLNVHTDQPSNFQIGESSGTKTDELVELSYENEKLKETVQSLTEENERSKYVLAAWKKSNEAVNQMSTYQRHPKCKFGLGYKGGKSANRTHSKELNLNKNKISFISFIKSSSTDTEADHEIPLTKEIKYVSPTDTAKWLHLERRKVNRSVRNETDRRSYRTNQHSPTRRYNETPIGRQRDVKPHSGEQAARELGMVFRQWLLQTHDRKQGMPNMKFAKDKSDIGIMLRYSVVSKAYRVYNTRTLNVEESSHVVFDESVESNTASFFDLHNWLENMNIQPDDEDEVPVFRRFVYDQAAPQQEGDTSVSTEEISRPDSDQPTDLSNLDQITGHLEDITEPNRKEIKIILLRLQDRPKKYQRYMPIIGRPTFFLVQQETNFSRYFNRRGRISCIRKLLCSTPLDSTAIEEFQSNC